MFENPFDHLIVISPKLGLPVDGASDKQIAEAYPHFLSYNNNAPDLDDWIVGRGKVIRLHHKLTRRPGLGQRRFSFMRKKVTVGWLDA